MARGQAALGVGVPAALCALLAAACGRPLVMDGDVGGFPSDGPDCLFLEVTSTELTLDLTEDVETFVTIVGNNMCDSGGSVDVSIAGDDAFEVVSAPDIASWEPEFVLAYRPSAPGTHEATVLIEVDDGFDTAVDIDLSGQASGPHPSLHPLEATVDPAAGTCETVSFRVENPGDQSLSVTVALDDALSTAAEGLTVEAGETTSLPITACSEGPEPVSSRAVITTNSALVPTVELTIHIEPSPG